MKMFNEAQIAFDFTQQGSSVGNSSNSFADQLIAAIIDRKQPLRKIAELAGIQMQSLSRFVGQSREAREKQTGLEMPTIERLWSFLNLVVARCSESGDVYWMAHSASFGDQLRNTIESSTNIRVEILKGSGVSESSLSLFLSRKRDGLSFHNIERLWGFFNLTIFTSDEVANHRWLEATVHPLDAVVEDDGQPFCY